jgi:hypothetical protein
VLDEGKGRAAHVCDPQTLETIKLIKRDSKPCPTCKALIYKIDGCDQMWCIQCKTAFSWVTGRIETGRIHNPEYYRWMREHNNGVVPREIGDGGGCPDNLDQLPRASTVNVMCEGLPSRDNIMRTHQMLEHITWVCVYTRDAIARNGNNHDLRVKFLRKQITEDDFKTKLQRKEKHRRHKQAYLNIYNLLVTVGTQAFLQFMANRDPNALFAMIREICEYCLEQVEMINTQFSSNSQEAINTINTLLHNAV